MMERSATFIAVSPLVFMALIAAAITLNLHEGMCMGRSPGKKITRPDCLKVEFFKNEDPDKSLGTAEWRNEKLSINVTDPELEKILTSTIATTKGVTEGDRHVVYRVELKPGTLEHLEAAAYRAWGYFGSRRYDDCPADY